MERAHIGIGDLPEVGRRVDRHLAEGIRDARRGKTHGPYVTVTAAIRALERRAQRQARTRRPSEH
jgi:hypothetical protein